jgi:WS/DGAT/MGAT family acyltransferase
MPQPLTETEALMWNVGRDPSLASTMGLVAMLDGRPEPDRVRAAVSNMVAASPRLRQRVAEPIGPGRPHWEVDQWFDLDHHLRFQRHARSSASDADLRRVAAQLINDPFDPNRPLWQFHLVTGLRGGNAALVSKVHHSVSDGPGLLRLAAHLLEFEPDAAPPDPVDLDAIVAADLARQDADQASVSGPGRVIDLLRQATKLPGPIQAVEAGAGIVQTARAATDQLARSKASELWSSRSPRRHLEAIVVPLEPLKDRAHALEVSLNDLFVAACAEGAMRYHQHFDREPEQLTVTVVVHTGAADSDAPLGAEGDNVFTPVAIGIPGAGADADERLAVIRAEVRSRREALADQPDMLSTLGAVGGLVPSRLTASVTLEGASRVDFATSNLPGPPLPVWLAGKPITRMIPVGPVAGTACNITLMSDYREVVIGLHIDPVAVARPDLLTRSITEGFGAYGVPRR